MDPKFKSPKEVDESKKEYQPWRCGFSGFTQYTKGSMAIGKNTRSVSWKGWICTISQITSWRQAAFKTDC